MTWLGKFCFSCATPLYFLIIQKIFHLRFLKSIQYLFKFCIKQILNVLNTDECACMKLSCLRNGSLAHLHYPTHIYTFPFDDRASFYLVPIITMVAFPWVQNLRDIKQRDNSQRLSFGEISFMHSGEGSSKMLVLYQWPILSPDNIFIFT